MHKSSIVLGVFCLILLLATGFVLLGLNSEKEVRQGLVEGDLNIGIPGMSGEEEDRIESEVSSLLWDTEADIILFEENAFKRRPIASITKLMTAMVALDYGVDMNAEVTIQPDEYTVGGKLLLHPGEFVTMENILHASLMGSANNATFAYVRVMGIPEKDFIRAMNRKAIELELEQTEFFDVTGLDQRNVSTAYEVARMAEVAFNDYPLISEITSKTEYSYLVGGSGREHTIRNTNKLISKEDIALSGGKTGYLYEANFCLVIQGVGEQANRISVVLGSASERNSFSDTKELLYR